MNSQKGFALIGLISLLPVILAGGLAVFSTFGFLKSDLGTLNACRAKQLQIQNKAGKNLSKLLKLNPRALKLRIQQAHAEKALAAAIESGQPPAIAAAEAYLLKIQMQRQVLAIKQKVLIQTADIWLASGGADLPKELQREWSQHNTPLKSWIQSSLRLTAAKVPKLAVQADIPEVAPVYQLLPHFEEAQSWEQTWNVEFRTVSWAQKFLNF
ncbi:MAG TPA: hypothetical protein VIG33_16300, partial [Pseudobdellovibrionaceae bacterium]